MSGSPPLTLRPDLEGLSPYVPPQRPARYRMNTNESPYAPPRAVMLAIGDALAEAELNRYPDKDARSLFQSLAAHLEWPADGLWIANGSNEVFLHLFLAFGGAGRTALTFDPTYSLHGLIARITGTRSVSVPRSDSFAIDLDTVRRAIEDHKPELVLLCSPNNPTGNLDPPSTVGAVLDLAPGIVVIDEAYGEFAGEDASARRLLLDHDNLIVTRTLSKAWRLAGARIGYLMASPKLVSQLEVVRLPYHLSALTQVIGCAALAYSDALLETVKAITAERDRISVELQAMGVKSFKSSANFVLFQVDDPVAVWEGLLERDVLVRNYAGIPGIERCLRVTAGLPEETEAFLNAMKEVIDE